MVDKDKPSSREVLFLHMISMFQVAAMQQLGKLMDPVSGKVDKDLEQAKVSIDILDILKEKTRGNLTKAEEEFLGKVLFELHMNYVDELKASKEADTEEPKTEGRGGAADTGEAQQNQVETAKKEKGKESKKKKRDG